MVVPSAEMYYRFTPGDVASPWGIFPRSIFIKFLLVSTKWQSSLRLYWMMRPFFLITCCRISFAKAAKASSPCIQESRTFLVNGTTLLMYFLFHHVQEHGDTSNIIWIKHASWRLHWFISLLCAMQQEITLSHCCYYILKVIFKVRTFRNNMRVFWTIAINCQNNCT